MKAIFSTRDLKLATILTTLGFEFETPTAPVTRVTRDSGHESTVFHFLANHPATGQPANDVMRSFARGDELLESEPESPIAYMLAALRNRDALVGVVKRTPRQVDLERNGTSSSISENATPEDRARFAKFI